MTEFDLLVIGAGINGAGIARDAAGQGHRVLLCDAGDIGGATSCSSTKLIHGGLRYLEFYEFALVRKALAERETILSIAPHIAWPLGFVLPHAPGLRPAWMIRLGLFLYDHLARRIRVPGSQGIDLRVDAAGACLQPQYQRGFRYWDGWIEDNRLAVLNAMDAAEHGADVKPRTSLVSAVAEQQGWRCRLSDGQSLSARVLVNCAGPWAHEVAAAVMGFEETPKLRLVKGSHIIVPRINPTEDAYFCQQPDGRIMFIIPYEGVFSLIGTTESTYTGDPRAAAATEADFDYLLAAANRYLKTPLVRDDIRWSYAGVRPLIDEAGQDNRTASRDYQFVTHQRGTAQALTVLGGKLTTYRVLAEAVMQKVSPWLDKPWRSWTGTRPLPGGEGAPACPDWLPEAMAQRMLICHGSRLPQVLGDARTLADLGPVLGGRISRCEVDYMVRHEWVRTADDLLWRRTKLGLHLGTDAQQKIAEWVGFQPKTAPEFTPV